MFVLLLTTRIGTVRQVPKTFPPPARNLTKSRTRRVALLGCIKSTAIWPRQTMVRPAEPLSNVAVQICGGSRCGWVLHAATLRVQWEIWSPWSAFEVPAKWICILSHLDVLRRANSGVPANSMNICLRYGSSGRLSFPNRPSGHFELIFWVRKETCFRSSIIIVTRKSQD